MIREILSDIFSPYSSLGERCWATLIVLLVLVIVGLFCYLGFTFVDSAAITPTRMTVTVVDVKEVVPAYTTIIMVRNVTIPEYNPESYRLHFKLDGEKVSSSVEKKLFEEINVGDRIEVVYGFGRLSKSHQPTRIRLIGN